MCLLLFKQGDPGVRGPMGNPGREGPKVDIHNCARQSKLSKMNYSHSLLAEALKSYSIKFAVQRVYIW